MRFDARHIGSGVWGVWDGGVMSWRGTDLSENDAKQRAADMNVMFDQYGNRDPKERHEGTDRPTGLDRRTSRPIHRDLRRYRPDQGREKHRQGQQVAVPPNFAPVLHVGKLAVGCPIIPSRCEGAVSFSALSGDIALLHLATPLTSITPVQLAD